MKGKRLLSLAVVPILAGAVSICITAPITYHFLKPKVVRVATYGRYMPWDALVTRADSPYADALAIMVTRWTDISQGAIPQVFSMETLGIRNIKDAKWSDWDPVKDACEALDSRFLEEYRSLIQELKQPQRFTGTRPATITATSPLPPLRVAVTPERGGTGLKKKTDDLVSAVRKTFPTDGQSATPAIEGKVYAKYEDVITALTGGKLDFVLCSPFSTHIAHEGMGERLTLLGQTQKTPYDGYNVVLIKSDDGNRLPLDYGKYVFITNSTSSTSGYLIPLVMLEGLGVPLPTLKIDRSHFLSDHDAVIDKVASYPGYIAGVPSDKIDPRFDSAWESAWHTSALGAGAMSLIIIIVRVLRIVRAEKKV